MKTKIYFQKINGNDSFIGKINKKIIMSSPFIKTVDSPIEADIIITRDTVVNLNLLYKTIYIATEAPRTSHRKWCYSHFDDFKLVICHNPQEGKINQIPFTPDDAAQYFPYKADAYKQERNNTTIKNRGIFFAGKILNREIDLGTNGGHNICPLRKTLGEYFIKNLPNSKFVGIGWNGQTSKSSMWRRDKQVEIKEADCDFILALENTIYPNYLTEKIWDGFNSDRVTLYLGDPNIEKHIPLNCFIDLRPYYNLETRQFNLEDLYKRIKYISQEEYDDILANAREFIKTTSGKYNYYLDLLTDTIIDFIIKN